MRFKATALISVVLALILLPCFAYADEQASDASAAAADHQTTQVADGDDKQSAGGGESSGAATNAEKEASAKAAGEKVLQSEYALLKSDGRLYRADKKGKALEGGDTWSGDDPLASVKKLFVDADVTAIGIDEKSGIDYAHPVFEVAVGHVKRKAQATFGAQVANEAKLSGLQAVAFKTGKKGKSAVALIGEDAFAGSSVAILSNLDKTAVASVGARAFANCSQLESIVLPKSCAYVGEDAFSGCGKLVELTMRSKRVVTLADGRAFAGSPLFNPFERQSRIYVPKAVRASYMENHYPQNRWYRYHTKIAAMPNLSHARVKVESAAYTGKELTPAAVVQYGQSKLKKTADYTIKYSDNTDAGVALAKITGAGKYEGSTQAAFSISKAGNTMSVSAQSVTGDYYALNYVDQVIPSSIKVENANGKVTYKLVDGSLDGQISIDKQTGAITVAKGVYEGTYPVSVKVKAAGDGNHRSTSKTVEFDIDIDAANSPPSAYKFMAIAQREYEEGIANGTKHHGDTKYYKTFVNSYQSWCSEFVGWCLIEAGLEKGVTLPKNASYAKAYYNFYKDRPDIATIHANDGSYAPQPGDIVLQVKSRNRFWHTEMITWSDGYNYGGISGGTHVGETSRSLGNKEYYYFITINWDAIAEMAGY